MKVKVLSDLHIEFQKLGDSDFDPGTGEVLILAGDICDAAAFLQRCDVDLKDRYLRFFERCAAGYNKVYYVMGNHEHYNGFFSETVNILRENLPEGITILDNQSEFYKGWHFVGATMWSDFGKEDPQCMDNAEGGLNDYQYIYTDRIQRNNPADFTRLENINAKYILAEHKNTIAWFDQCLKTLNGPVFVITHHCPSFQSIDEDYTGSDVVTAYASDLTRLIQKNPNVRMWSHGHVHSSKLYKVGNCTVLSNPKGYPGKGGNPNFKWDFALDLPN